MSRTLRNFNWIAGVSVIAALSGVMTAAVPEPAAPALSQRDADAIALEGYIYFYPLITMDVTRRISTNVEPGKRPGMGPIGMFHHMRAYPPADFREVVRPNFDTLYSQAWFDVSKEPVVLTLPDTDGRYYVAPIYDMWTDAYAAPGKRTSGTRAQTYVIAARGWKGTLPAGAELIEHPTSQGWIIIRTQTNGPSDYPAVHRVQDGYQLTRLSQLGKTRAAPALFKPDPSIDMSEPLAQVNNMAASRFFPYAADLMKANPPHTTDWAMVTRLKKLGIVAGQPFDYAGASPVVKQALDKAPRAALAVMKEKSSALATVKNGWQMNTDTMGVFGNFYLKRAIIALAGLGANSVEDAVYPMIVVDSEGQIPVGENSYVMHFTKDGLPPADAFWSITMYDQQGFQAANPINRFAIGDRDDLHYNADGSLDIYIQNTAPAGKESNWLPSPKGPLGITMRLYAPRLEVLDGRWVPPPLMKVN